MPSAFTSAIARSAAPASSGSSHGSPKFPAPSRGESRPGGLRAARARPPRRRHPVLERHAHDARVREARRTRRSPPLPSPRSTCRASPQATIASAMPSPSTSPRRQASEGRERGARPGQLIRRANGKRSAGVHARSATRVAYAQTRPGDGAPPTDHGTRSPVTPSASVVQCPPASRESSTRTAETDAVRVHDTRREKPASAADVSANTAGSKRHRRGQLRRAGREQAAHEAVGASDRHVGMAVAIEIVQRQGAAAAREASQAAREAAPPPAITPIELSPASASTSSGRPSPSRSAAAGDAGPAPAANAIGGFMPPGAMRRWPGLRARASPGLPSPAGRR